MDDAERSPGLPGSLNPARDKVLANLVWTLQNGDALDQIEMALFRFQRWNPSLRLARRDGKVVTEWGLALDSLPLGFLRVSGKFLEIDASVQALDAWRIHRSAAEGNRLWRTLMIELFQELRLNPAPAPVPEPGAGDEPQQRAGRPRRPPPRVPKGKALAKWTATWRFVRPYAERGLTDPRELLGLLARDRKMAHLAHQSEDTMRKIVTAGLAGRLDGRASP